MSIRKETHTFIRPAFDAGPVHKGWVPMPGDAVRPRFQGIDCFGIVVSVEHDNSSIVLWSSDLSDGERSRAEWAEDLRRQIMEETLIFALFTGDSRRKELAPGDLVSCDGWAESFGMVVSVIDGSAVVMWTTPPGLITNKPDLFNRR